MSLKRFGMRYARSVSTIGAVVNGRRKESSTDLELESRIASIDVARTVATVGLELDNWTRPPVHGPVHAPEGRWRVEDYEQGLPSAFLKWRA